MSNKDVIVMEVPKLEDNLARLDSATNINYLLVSIKHNDIIDTQKYTSLKELITDNVAKL